MGGSSGGGYGGGGLGSNGLEGGLAGSTTAVSGGAGAAPVQPAAPTTQAPTTNPLLGPLEPGAPDANPDALRIIPDDQNNAVLLYGTLREVDTIEAMLRKIDILPLQVRIGAVIAKVQLNDNLQYGTQFFFESGGLNGILSDQTQNTVETPALSPAQAQLNLSFPRLFHRRPRPRRGTLRHQRPASGHESKHSIVVRAAGARQSAGTIASRQR